jgi:hypothetical protein
MEINGKNAIFLNAKFLHEKNCFKNVRNRFLAIENGGIREKMS